jgi:signal peptidase I
MKPTLVAGANVVAMTYKKGTEPQYGDVVLFRVPRNPTATYIFRVVGMPGDRVQVSGGHLYINDQPVERQRIEDFVETEDGRTSRVKRWRETLPNGVSHDTLDLVESGFYDNTPVYDVPAEHYFVMGDNRDNAADSRVLAQVGYVPAGNIIGRAVPRQ